MPQGHSFRVSACPGDTDDIPAPAAGCRRALVLQRPNSGRGSKDLNDRSRDGTWLLMPPEPEHGSSRLSQSLIALSISRDVAPQLPGPIVSVRRRLGAVLRAGVPKAPVHLHRDALSRERRADSNAPARQRGIVLPEAQAGLLQLRAHPNLWSCVLGAISLHSPPHPLRRCPGIGVRRRSCTRPWHAI